LLAFFTSTFIRNTAHHLPYRLLASHCQFHSSNTMPPLTRNQVRQSFAYSPLSHLPVELVMIILSYAACAPFTETPWEPKFAAIRQISNIKCVCKCFATIGDDWLVKEANSQEYGPLSNMTCEPTLQTLQRLRTIAANATLRSIIRSFICVDDKRCSEHMVRSSSIVAAMAKVIKLYPIETFLVSSP